MLVSDQFRFCISSRFSLRIVCSVFYISSMWFNSLCGLIPWCVVALCSLFSPLAFQWSQFWGAFVMYNCIDLVLSVFLVNLQRATQFCLTWQRSSPSVLLPVKHFCSWSLSLPPAANSGLLLFFFLFFQVVESNCAFGYLCYGSLLLGISSGELLLLQPVCSDR